MSDHALSAQHSSDWRYWFGEQRGTLLAFGTLFNADLHTISWKVRPSNCGVRTDRAKPMRCRPGNAPSSTSTP